MTPTTVTTAQETEARPKTAAYQGRSATQAHVVRRYLEDIFMQARCCSHKVRQSDAKVQKLIDGRPSGDLVVGAVQDHEIVVSRLLAAIAPSAVEYARVLAAATRIYTESVCELDDKDVDELMQPMFEAAGLEDDFMAATGRGQD